jgi:translocator protein
MFKKIKNFALSLMTVFLIAYVGGLTTKSSVGTWYQTLKMSPLTPKAAAFPIVWTILYLMIAYSLKLLLDARDNKQLRGRRLRFFFMQLFLNFLWSPVFFGMKNPSVALIIIIPLWLMILQNMLYYRKISLKISYLLIPYFIWSTFAVYLNLYIVINN